MELAIIHNPASGGGAAAKLLPKALAAFEKKGIKCTVFESCFHTHVVELCSQLEIERFDAVAAMGGDGTNFQMLNGLLAVNKPEKLPPLAVIPVGSGNSFAKYLNIDTFEQGIDAVFSGRPRSVDVCSFSQDEASVYFVNLAGFGFVTDVAKTAQKFKIFKDFSYIIGVLHRTVSLCFHQMTLEVDGRIIEGENCFVEFCNSRYTGGDMLMAPKAEIDDGLMDIVIVGRLSRLGLLKTLPKIFSGTHLEHPAVQYIQAKKAVIRTTPEKILLPDGEILGTTPAVVRVHPHFVRYLS